MSMTREEEVAAIKNAAAGLRKALREHVPSDALVRARAGLEGVVSLCREAGLNDGQAAAAAIFVTIGPPSSTDQAAQLVNALLGKPAEPSGQLIAALVFECFAEGAPDAEG